MEKKREKSQAPAVDSNEVPEIKEPEVVSESKRAATDPNEVPEIKPSKPKDRKTGVPKFLEPYRKAYPKCRVFHVTSDRMVFLESDRNAALVHQQSIGEGSVETYKM